MHPDYLSAKETFKKKNLDIMFKRVSFTWASGMAVRVVQ
jgi:hypothetical protein